MISFIFASVTKRRKSFPHVCIFDKNEGNDFLRCVKNAKMKEIISFFWSKMQKWRKSFPPVKKKNYNQIVGNYSQFVEKPILSSYFHHLTMCQKCRKITVQKGSGVSLEFINKIKYLIINGDVILYLQCWDVTLYLPKIHPKNTNNKSVYTY